MSDKETNALVQYEEQLKRELAGLRDNVETPSSNRISTKGKLFTMPGGRSDPGPMLAIVLDFIALNQYWSTPYNANTRVPADCQAINRVIKELSPDPALSPKLQHANCKDCPRNQWNTGPNGKGKACKNERKLLLVAPDFNEKSEPMTLIVSPTGTKHWDKYLRDLASDHGVLPVQVITQIRFDPNQSYPTLLFDLPQDPAMQKHGKLALAMHMRGKYQEMLQKNDPAQEAA